MSNSFVGFFLVIFFALALHTIFFLLIVVNVCSLIVCKDLYLQPYKYQKWN